MAKEKSFENKIKDHLEKQGCWYIKYWAGAKFTKEGIPDILACYRGHFIAIEVKAAGGKPSILQLITLRKIRESGGIGALVYPKDWDGLKSYLSGEPEGKEWYIKNIKFQDDWFNKLLVG